MSTNYKDEIPSLEPQYSNDEYSFTSNSTMNSDFEIPIALRLGKFKFEQDRVSTKLSQYMNTMTSIRESQSMRSSVITATKWKKQGYHPYKQDTSGYTALHRAAKRGDPKLIISLLAMYDGLPYDLASLKSYNHHQIALHIAAKFSQLEAVALLSAPEYRTHINQTDRNGNTPLHFAVTSMSSTSSSVTALLLKRGADPAIKNNAGVFPIIAHILTTQTDNPEIVNLLLRHGSDPNTRDAEGNTVLHIAVEQGLWKIASCLVYAQANWMLGNDQGTMVLDVLSQSQLAWLAKFLTSPPEWVDSKSKFCCMACHKKFSFFVRKHHCRLCGRLVCSTCSKYKRHLPFPNVPSKKSGKKTNQMMRVCSTCISVRPMNADVWDRDIGSTTDARSSDESQSSK